MHYRLTWSFEYTHPVYPYHIQYPISGRTFLESCFCTSCVRVHKRKSAWRISHIIMHAHESASLTTPNMRRQRVSYRWSLVQHPHASISHMTSSCHAWWLPSNNPNAAYLKRVSSATSQVCTTYTHFHLPVCHPIYHVSCSLLRTVTARHWFTIRAHSPAFIRQTA